MWEKDDPSVKSCQHFYSLQYTGSRFHFQVFPFRSCHVNKRNTCAFFTIIPSCMLVALTGLVSSTASMPWLNARALKGEKAQAGDILVSKFKSDCGLVLPDHSPFTLTITRRKGSALARCQVQEGDGASRASVPVRLLPHKPRHTARPNGKYVTCLTDLPYLGGGLTSRFEIYTHSGEAITAGSLYQQKKKPTTVKPGSIPIAPVYIHIYYAVKESTFICSPSILILSCK